MKEHVLVKVFVESLLKDNPKLTVTQLDAVFSLGRKHYWNLISDLHHNLKES
tara:strand:- start:74 stop:229 length:156 start_codon:yes stop_codon:yes gene_type:complete